MDQEEADKSPAEQWQSSLNATCNRLCNQYLNLIRSASSKVELDMTTGGMDPRGGGGVMRDEREPPPPLASDAIYSSLQANLATQNICVATSNLLESIRILRYSALLLDVPTIQAEEEEQCHYYQQQTQHIQQQDDSITQYYTTLLSTNPSSTTTNTK